MCGFQMIMGAASMVTGFMQSQSQQAAANAQMQAQQVQVETQRQQWEYQRQADEQARLAAEQAAQIQRQTAQNEAVYNQQVAENNAVIARNQAASETEAGRLQEAQAQLKGSIKAGEQRAAMGASGALLDGPTNEAILVGTAQDTELDALVIRTNTEARANAELARARNFESEASLQNWRATDFGRDPSYSLLTKSSPVSSKWAPYQAA